MKTIIIIILLLAIAVLCFILWVLKISEEKRFCHYCETLIFGKEHKNKTHCPYCGNELTSWEEFQRNDKDGKEDNNSSQPFEEFNKIDKDGE